MKRVVSQIGCNIRYNGENDPLPSFSKFETALKKLLWYVSALYVKHETILEETIRAARLSMESERYHNSDQRTSKMIGNNTNDIGVVA